jgi:hypothetical protein
MYIYTYILYILYIYLYVYIVPNICILYICICIYTFEQRGLNEREACRPNETEAIEEAREEAREQMREAYESASSAKESQEDTNMHESLQPEVRRCRLQLEAEAEALEEGKNMHESLQAEAEALESRNSSNTAYGHTAYGHTEPASTPLVPSKLNASFTDRRPEDRGERGRCVQQEGGGGGGGGGGCVEEKEHVLKPMTQMTRNPINQLNPVSVNGEELLNTLIDRTAVLVRPCGSFKASCTRSSRPHTLVA